MSDEDLRRRIADGGLLPLALTLNPLQKVLEDILDLIGKQKQELQDLKEVVNNKSDKTELQQLADTVENNKKDSDQRLEDLKTDLQQTADTLQRKIDDNDEKTQADIAKTNNKVDENAQKLEQLEKDLKDQLQDLNNKFDQVHQTVDDHEDRIRKLENRPPQNNGQSENSNDSQNSHDNTNESSNQLNIDDLANQVKSNMDDIKNLRDLLNNLANNIPQNGRSGINGTNAERGFGGLGNDGQGVSGGQNGNGQDGRGFGNDNDNSNSAFNYNDENRNGNDQANDSSRFGEPNSASTIDRNAPGSGSDHRNGTNTFDDSRDGSRFPGDGMGRDGMNGIGNSHDNDENNGYDDGGRGLNHDNNNNQFNDRNGFDPSSVSERSNSEANCNQLQGDNTHDGENSQRQSSSSNGQNGANGNSSSSNGLNGHGANGNSSSLNGLNGHGANGNSSSLNGLNGQNGANGQNSSGNTVRPPTSGGSGRNSPRNNLMTLPNLNPADVNEAIAQLRNDLTNLQKRVGDDEQENNKHFNDIDEELKKLARELADRPDRGLIERLFEKFKDSLNGVVDMIDGKQGALGAGNGNYATKEDIKKLENLVKSINQEFDEAAASRKCNKCLSCGRGFRVTTGSIQDAETMSILGAAPISSVAQDIGKPTFVYGTDNELYYSTTPRGRTFCSPRKSANTSQAQTSMSSAPPSTP